MIKNLIRLEELAMFALAVYLYTLLDYKWWVFALLFLTPDIGMLGYLINTKAGALMYNIFHHKGIAIALYLAGIFLDIPVSMFIGLLLFAHSSFYRIFGYGLKYTGDFKSTHLGTIGKAS